MIIGNAQITSVYFMYMQLFVINPVKMEARVVVLMCVHVPKDGQAQHVKQVCISTIITLIASQCIQKCNHFIIHSDVDECSSSALNNCNQQCTNTIGSYTCSCTDGGYRLSLAGHTCIGRCMHAYTATFMHAWCDSCLLYTSPSPRDATLSRMPSSA